jgi:curved DNA-binding protein CbpA
MLKDYYKILQIPPHATLQEIKQAYRHLAMVYHPDKSKNDPYAEVQFHEIKEAYEILTNPVKKETYLQKRWYNQSIGKKRTAGAITPVSILLLSLELEKYVSTLDVHRMNKEGLFNYINELLSSDTVETLKKFNEPEINHQIIGTILTAINPLQPKFAKLLSARLEQLANNDKSGLDRIKKFLLEHKKNFLFGKYQPLVIIILTILICLLIYYTSK